MNIDYFNNSNYIPLVYDYNNPGESYYRYLYDSAFEFISKNINNFNVWF